MAGTGRQVVSTLGGRLVGRVGLVLAAGVVLGQASGAAPPIALALVPVGLVLFVLGVALERRGEPEAQSSQPSDP